MSKKGYILADVQITNPEQYAEYRKWSTLAMQAHGAKPLIRGGATQRLEGREPGRMVLLEFPSTAAAQAFYDSPQYRRARNAREGAAIMNMMIVEGV
ncbi:hypothetical protein IP84_07850 [beta proteobacterium AAP99]|nr:hypothetical protein IP84_07850 [beta proteobacterium AAP99]